MIKYILAFVLSLSMTINTYADLNKNEFSVISVSKSEFDVFSLDEPIKELDKEPVKTPKVDKKDKVEIARGADGYSVWIRTIERPKWIKISEGRRWQPKICTPQGCIPGRWILIPISEIKIPKVG